MRSLVVLLMLATACGSSSGATQPRRPLVVFAAASLTKAFTAEGKAFEQVQPRVRVTFSFAGSQSLVAQIGQGAPADVLATADESSMAATRLPESRVFARNALALITAPGNPRRVTTLADLRASGLRVVLGGPTVPVGRAARVALTAAGVTVHPVSLEQDVKGVVTKVRLGEADAGIAYVTDVKAAAGAIAGTTLPGTTTRYPVAVVRPSDDATAFRDFLLGTQGQSVLASYGFLPPT